MMKEVSEKYHISPDTLRYYERVGAIPRVNRTKSGIRDYTEQDIGCVENVICMRNAGVPVEMVIEYAKLCQQGDDTFAAYGQYMEFCQLQLNYMDWHFQNAQGKVELMNRADIPVWVMEPLRGGKLAKASGELAAVMQSMRPEETVPGWAFRFLQSIPGVTMVLSGMSTMEQLKANIATYETDEPLGREEFDSLVKCKDAEVRKEGLPCTACHYCTSHCPKELPIPELIALYNEHKATGGGFIAPMAVGSMPQEKRPASCIGCRSCERVCPQQIKISEMMADFTSMIGM